MSYKEKARAFVSAVNNYDIPLLEQMIEEHYIQHNPFVPTGRSAFLALVPNLKKHNSKIINVRMLEDGQHVVMHHKWENASPFGHDKAVAFHIIRFDSQSLIAEHWNIMMKDKDPDSLSFSLADGTTKIEDISRSSENRNFVVDFFELLSRSAQTKAVSFIPEHLNSRFLSSGINYLKLHKVFGEGNFTLSVSEGSCLGVLSAIYDLFRFENQKIAEHWRITQEIPKNNLANHNTMFGF